MATPPRWIWLIVVGIACSTVVNVVSDHATNFDSPELFAFQPPAWVQALSRISYVMILVAAALYATAPAGLRFGRYYRGLMALWIGYGLVLSIRTLQPHDFLTSTVWFLCAPGCCIISCWLYASADRRSWDTLAEILSYACVGVAIIVLVEVVLLHSTSRGEAYSRIYTYSSILEVAAIVSYGWFARARKAWIGVIPLLALVGATMVMQTRLMVVELIALFVFYQIFSYRKPTTSTIVAWCLGGIMMVGLVYLVWYQPSGLRNIVPASASSFWDRRTEDTRSQQFVNFFAKVPPDTFLLGMGIPRAGQYNGLGVKGIDFGFVNILFIGGIPALVLFFIIHLLPAIRCLGSRFDSLDAACLASVMTYFVRMFSSTVPGITPNYLILMLLVGRCVMLTQEKKQRRFGSGYSGYPADQFLREPEAVAVASKGLA